MNKKRKLFIIIFSVFFVWCLIGAYIRNYSAIPIVIAVYVITLFLTGEGSIKKKAAIVLMVIPVFISFTQEFTYTKTFLVFRSTTNYSIAPSFISALAGIFLYLSIVVRGRINLFSNVYETVIVVLNILFCASFLEIFFPKEPWKIPFLNISSQSFLIMAIIFSWIGMRSLAGFVWIGLFLMALGRIVGLNVGMGLWGVVYIMAAFVSIGLQLKDHVHLLSDFKNDFVGISSRIAEDSKLSISETKKAVKKVASMAATAATGVPVNLPEDDKPKIE